MDELCYYALFFRILVEFFFHYRNLQMITVLTVYNTALLAYVSSSLSLDEGNLFLTLFGQALLLGTYVIIYILYKGSLWEPLSSESQGTKPDLGVDSATDVEGNATADVQTGEYFHTLHYSATTKQLYRLACAEVRFILSSKRGNNASKSGKRVQQSLSTVKSYYHLINVGVKFLIRHCDSMPKPEKFNKPIFRAIFLYLVFLHALYSTMYTQYYPFLKVFSDSCPSVSTDGCRSFWILYFFLDSS